MKFGKYFYRKYVCVYGYYNVLLSVMARTPEKGFMQWLRLHKTTATAANRKIYIYPDSKVHGANMGPTWVLLAPDMPHVVYMNLDIRVDILQLHIARYWALHERTKLKLCSEYKLPNVENIHHPFRQAMRCLSWAFEEKWPLNIGIALYWLNFPADSKPMRHWVLFMQVWE